MTAAASLAATEIAPGALVRVDVERPLGQVRMVNRHSRLSVLVAWVGGRLEWRDPAQLVVVGAPSDARGVDARPSSRVAARGQNGGSMSA